jgi:hypothetical protein
MTGDAGSYATAASFCIFGLLVVVGDGENLFEHLLQLLAFQPYRSGFDGESARAEGFGFEAVAVELFGYLGEGDHLSGKKID